MKKILLYTAFLSLSLTASAQGLKDVLGKYFLVGAAINSEQAKGLDSLQTQVITRNFNSIVAEDCMKPESVQPKEGKFRWRQADRFVQFGEQHQMTIIGHCLVWHSQTKEWMFKDSLGNTASRELLIQRMKTHIQTVVGRYKGRIKGWDVCNEVVLDNGNFRPSPWYQIIGPDYIELAYRFAHEADPDAELYYNDYSLANPTKRAAVCQLIRNLKAKGCRIDAIGMQSHNGMDFPNLKEYEASIDSFAACGVKVMVTELDMNVLPNPESFSGAEVSQHFEYTEAMDPYKNGLDKKTEELINKRWLALFQIYHRHRHQISRVATWGVSDRDSWMNNWPIPGRTAYPLLFDREYRQKPIVRDILKIFK